MGHGNNSYNFAYGRKESGLGAVHSDATPSMAVDATYRGPVRDGLAYRGAKRRYTAKTDRLLTERCSQQSIRGSKWDYVGPETARRYMERRAKGENNKLVTTVGDGLNTCRTVLKFRGSTVVTICTAQRSLYVPPA